MKNFSGMLTFQVEDGLTLASRMAKELQVIHYAVSLGHHRSLIFWMDTPGLMETSFRLAGEQLASYKAFAGEGILRISAGFQLRQYASVRSVRQFLFLFR